MQENGSRTGRLGWLIAMAIIVIAGVVVPYGILGGAEAPGISVAVFWLLFGFVVVAMIAIGVSRWRD